MLSEFTDQAVNELVNELRKPSNQRKVQRYLLDPCISYVIGRLSPYAIAIYLLLILNFIGLVMLAYLLYRSLRGSAGWR